jgi:hypothetical protein
VAVSRRGRMAYYRLEDTHVQMLLDVGLTHAQHSGPVRDLAPRAARTGRASPAGRGHRP